MTGPNRTKIADSLEFIENNVEYKTILDVYSTLSYADTGFNHAGL